MFRIINDKKRNTQIHICECGYQAKRILNSAITNTVCPNCGKMMESDTEKLTITDKKSQHDYINDSLIVEVDTSECKVKYSKTSDYSIESTTDYYKFIIDYMTSNPKEMFRIEKNGVILELDTDISENKVKQLLSGLNLYTPAAFNTASDEVKALHSTILRSARNYGNEAFSTVFIYYLRNRYEMFCLRYYPRHSLKSGLVYHEADNVDDILKFNHKLYEQFKDDTRLEITPELIDFYNSYGEQTLVEIFTKVIELENKGSISQWSITKFIMYFIILTKCGYNSGDINRYVNDTLYRHQGIDSYSMGVELLAKYAYYKDDKAPMFPKSLRMELSFLEKSGATQFDDREIEQIISEDYEKDGYIITSPHLLSDIVYNGEKLHYNIAPFVAAKSICEVYFLRDKAEPNKPLGTIFFDKDKMKVLGAKTYGQSGFTAEMREILDSWMKNVVEKNKGSQNGSLLLCKKTDCKPSKYKHNSCNRTKCRKT